MSEHLEEIKASAIGNPLEEVQDEAKRTGWKVRVMKVDGRNCVGTCDYDPSRINVVVESGKITEVMSIG